MKDWYYENEQWTKLPHYLKHLPLFTRHIDGLSLLFRTLWAIILKVLFFRFYIRLERRGDYKTLSMKYPKLFIISNHSSHLDAISIASSIPFTLWSQLYIAAAKDYFFSNSLFTFFSQHCLGAIPIDRKDKRGRVFQLIAQLLTDLSKMWIVFFPEGTRSRDGKVHDFKRGVSILSEKTNTPILYLYVQGNTRLMPKGSWFPRPGKITIHIGPVSQPAPIEQIYSDYKNWVTNIDPQAFEIKENESL